MEKISGRAPGARQGQRIVLFARDGVMWWVQPMSNQPFTPIDSDFTWQGATHLGTEYAALLVEEGYAPPSITDTLPGQGGKILAIAKTAGQPSGAPAPKTIRFSGYEWEVVETPTDSGGVLHNNSASNVWTDDKGRLHLRIQRQGEDWTCAEVLMTRSLGYGVYSFVFDELPPLESASVLGLFTWDPREAGQNHREINVELSRWGDPQTKNAQFVVQPYYVPANVFRFESPSGRVAHSFHWEPGRVAFRSGFRTSLTPIANIAEHVFTSGVPTPGGERVHINLYIFGRTRTPQQKPVEVVIEKFEYLP